MNKNNFFFKYFWGKRNWVNRSFVILIIFSIYLCFHFGEKENPKEAFMQFTRYLFWQEKIIPNTTLYNSLDQAHVKENIRKLIAKAKAEQYSEIGGVIFLKKKDGVNYLHFVSIKSDNKKVCEDILAHRDDDEYLINILKQEKDMLGMYTPKQSKDMLYKIENRINPRHLRNEDRNYYLDNAIDFYLDLSVNVYSLNNDELFAKVFHSRSSTVEFIGKFHIHTDGSKPTQEDYLGTKNFREFVIIAKSDGFGISVLEDLKLRKEFRFKY